MTTQLHNPANCVPAKGYRILTVEEMTKPLPEGAMFWKSELNKWVPSEMIGCPVDGLNMVSFAVPITLTPFESRLQNYLAVYAAVKLGAGWECRRVNTDGDWLEPSTQRIDYLEEIIIGGRYEVRLAPVPSEPVEKRWNKPEDVPGPVCWLRWHDGSIDMIVGISGEGVLCNGELISWITLQNIKYSTDRKTWLPCTCAQREETRG